MLQAAHRDGDVVNGAKAFAMVRKRMVKSAAEVEPHAVRERVPGGQGGASGGQAERFHHLRRVGNLQPQNVLVGQRSVAQARYPLGVMHPQNVFVGRRLGLYEVFRRSEAGTHQPVAQPLVFLGWEDVVPQVEVVPLGVNQREREHGIILAPIAAPSLPLR